MNFRLHDLLPSFADSAIVNNFFRTQLMTATSTSPAADNPKKDHRHTGSGVLIAINPTAAAHTTRAHISPYSMNNLKNRVTIQSSTPGSSIRIPGATPLDTPLQYLPDLY